MRSEEFRKLIIDEQLRCSDFIASANLDEYIAKLLDKAEFVVAFYKELCQGFVAYYCNDSLSRVAYITLVLVVPEFRGSGLGQSLVSYVLIRAKNKGFERCRLEVNANNESALALYKKMGFVVVEDRTDRYFLEVNL